MRLIPGPSPLLSAARPRPFPGLGVFVLESLKPMALDVGLGRKYGDSRIASCEVTIFFGLENIGEVQMLSAGRR